MNKKMPKFLSLLLVVVLLAVGVAAACGGKEATQPTAGQTTTTPPKSVTLTFYYPFARVGLVEAAVWWMEEVERRTGGQVKFNMVFGGALGTLTESPLNLKGRVFDVGTTSSVYNPGLYPASSVRILPFLTDSMEAIAFASYDLMEHPAIQAETVTALNQKPLFPLFTEMMELMSYVPAKTIEELRPLKIRGHGGSADILEALGLTSVAIPWEELPTASERRVVDAASMPAPITSRDFGYHDIYKYWIRIPFYYFAFWNSINLDTWNSLPPDVQAVMLEVAKDAPAKVVEIMGGEMESAWQDMKAAGVQQIVWSDAELNKMKEGAKPVLAKWVKDREAQGIPGQDLLDQFQALIAKYER